MRSVVLIVIRALRLDLSDTQCLCLEGYKGMENNEHYIINISLDEGQYSHIPAYVGGIRKSVRSHRANMIQGNLAPGFKVERMQPVPDTSLLAWRKSHGRSSTRQMTNSLIT